MISKGKNIIQKDVVIHNKKSKFEIIGKMYGKRQFELARHHQNERRYCD